MRRVRAWTERGHGVAMETASVGAYAIGVTWTQKPTPVLPSLWSATVLGWYGTPGGCAGTRQRSLTDLTHRHAQNHTHRPQRQRLQHMEPYGE